MPLPSIATVANLKALFRHRATARQHTPLAPREVEMAQDVWVMYLTSTTIPCKDFADVLQMLIALQVPQQPLLVKIATDFFESKQHFSFQDFLSLLEQCKTIHIRWLHKIQGKSLDDDLLEAFVAVGGEEDSGGEVDLDQMKEVISQFQLNVNLEKFVPPGPTNTNKSPSKENEKPLSNNLPKHLQFNGFAELLKDSKTQAARGQLPPLVHQGGGGIGREEFTLDILDDEMNDLGLSGVGTEGIQPLLSTMEFFGEDTEVGADGIVRNKHQGGGGAALLEGSMLQKSQSMFGRSQAAGAGGDTAGPTSGGNESGPGAGNSKTPDPAFGTSVTSPARGRNRNRRTYGTDSPSRARSTSPDLGRGVDASPSKKSIPARLQPLKKGPKKPKFANW